MADLLATISDQPAIDTASLADSTKRGNIKLLADDHNPVTPLTVQLSVEQIIAKASAAETQVDSIAALRALTTTPTTVYVKGHATAGDLGQGLFRLLVSSGRTPGDIDSSGEDDNGWHIVCTSTGAMYGRDDDVARPEHFGVVGSVDNAAALAASNQWAGLQRWLNMWGNPSWFPGIASVRGLAKWHKPPFVASARFYRCDDTLAVTVPSGSPSWYGGIVPSELNFEGSTWKTKTSNFPSFRVQINRNAGKSPIQLRFYKELNAGKAGWNATTYPQKYRDPAAYRAWSSTLTVYAGEEIKYTSGSTVHFYEVTVSGVTSGTPPTTSTSVQANGTASLQYLGTITDSSGKWMRDILCETRDIGVWVDLVDAFHELHIDGENCLVGVMECPRGSNVGSVGFCTIHSKYILGCKFSVVTACHLYDYLVADQTARLAMTNVPLNSIVRQSDNTTYDFEYRGGGESNPANWVSRAYRTAPGWTNDIHHKMNLAYARGNAVADNTQSVYGAVSTSFGGLPGPSGNTYDGIGVEFSEYPNGVTTHMPEMVLLLFDTGNEHDAWCRNDSPGKSSAAVFLPHVDVWLEQSKQCRVETLRAGLKVETLTYQRHRMNNCLNSVIETPYLPERVVEFTVNDLMQDAVFSGKDRVYFSKSSLVTYTTGVPVDYCDYGSGASKVYFNSADRTFDISQNISFAVDVEIPENSSGNAIVEIIPFFSTLDTTTKNAARWTVQIYDPITGTPMADLTPWPVVPVGSDVQVYLTATTADFIGPGSDKMQPHYAIPPRWARKIQVRIWGKHMRGYSVRLMNAVGGSVQPTTGCTQGRYGPMVNVAPERGIFRVPTRLNYISHSTNVLSLNKASGTTEYWATSGTQASLVGSEVAYQWAHDGSGGIYERNSANSAWVQIASGKSAVVPTDWVDV